MSGNERLVNWARLPFRELLREPLRNGHSAKESPDGSGVRTLTLTAVTAGDFSERNTKLTIAAPQRVADLWLTHGDILIERSNTPELVGTSRLYSGPAGYAVFPDLVIRARVVDGISPRFVALYLESGPVREYFRRAAQGISGSMPKISQGVIEALEVPLVPLPEQHRIVAAIESYFSRLDEAVTLLQRVQRSLKRYRASVLKAAVEGRLVPTEAELARAEGRAYEPASVLLERILEERRRRWKDESLRGAYKEPVAPDTSGLPELPEGWCWGSVGQVSADVVDCPHSTPVWSPAGRVCVRTTEFRPGRLELTNVRFVTESTYQERISRLRPEAGDVLYSREGGILGIACPVPAGIDLCLGQRMMLVRPAEASLGPYLMNVLNSPFTLRRVRRLTGGSASPHINVADVKAFPVPLPPLQEVRRILEGLDDLHSVAEALERTTSETSIRVARLHQSILKWAFEGRLADQDPNDEPASVLLERIRAERAVSHGGAGRRT